MTPNSFPLDIVGAILDYLVYETPEDDRKQNLSATLGSCSLTIVIIPPPEPTKPSAKKRVPKASIWKTKSRKRKKARQNRAPTPPPPPSPLSALLNTMENDESWVYHIQVLRIRGSWVTSDPHFPEVLNIFSRHQRLRTLAWDMLCNEDCDCDYEFTEALLGSLAEVLSMAQLTSIHLKRPCDRFLFDILGEPTVHCSSKTSAQAHPKTVRTDDEFLIRTYYLNPPDYRFDLYRLAELAIINFDDIDIAKILVGRASESLESLTWALGTTDGDGDIISMLEEDIKELSFKSLSALRTLNFEGWTSKYHDHHDYYSYPGLKYRGLFDEILKCPLPDTLETLNIMFESDIMINYPDPGANRRFGRSVREELILDKQVAPILEAAQAKGFLKTVRMHVAISGRRKRLKERRKEALDRYKSAMEESDQEDREPTGNARRSSNKLGMGTEAKTSEEEALEAWCRGEGDTSDTEDSYLRWKHLPRKVIAPMFSRIRDVKGVSFEVLNTEDYVSYVPISEVW